MSESAITASIQSQLNDNYYANLISLSILYYDYLLTFPLEVSRFWLFHETNWATALFYLNRYLSLVGHIPIAMEYFWTDAVDVKAKMCSTLQSFHQYFAIISQLVVGAMLIMRTYALYEHDVRVLVALITICVAVSGFGTWSIVTSKGDLVLAPDPVPRVGCIQTLNHNQGIHFAIAWSGLLLFDVSIFFLTLCKSVTYRHRGGRTLLNVLIRDGAMYFAMMVVANLANILTFFMGQAHTMGLLTTFTNVISSTMISRLMLNLRDPKLRSSRRTTYSQSTTVTSLPAVAYMTSIFNPTTGYDSQVTSIELADFRRN